MPEVNHVTEEAQTAGSSSDPEVETSEEDELFRAGVQQLEAMVDSVKADLLIEVFERNLGEDIDDKTFEEVSRAGALLAGDEGFSVIAAAATTDDGERIAQQGLSAEAQAFLIRVIALFGGALRRALHASNVPASRGHDWENLAPEAYFDIKLRRYMVEIAIEKFNGEKLMLRSSLRSTLLLARNILLAAMKIDDMSSVSGHDRERLMEVMEELRKRLEASAAVSGDDEEE